MGRMTLGECKEAVLKLINQYSIAGGVVPMAYNNQADYVARIVPLINDAQMEIAKTVRRIPAQMVITQAAIPNLLRAGDGMIVHGNVDRALPQTAAPARSYYFEVDGPATVYVEEYRSGEWLITDERVITPTEKGFVAVRGIAGSGENPLRFRLSGATPYLFKNGAFYEYAFADEAQVPAFGEYVEYELPEDYYQLNGRGIPHFNGGFVMGHDFRWRGDKTLMLRRELVGEFIVEYFRFPVRLKESDPDSTYLDNAPDTHDAIPYLVGSMLTAQDNQALSSRLYNIFETRISRMNEATFSENHEIEDVYGFNAGMGWG